VFGWDPDSGQSRSTKVLSDPNDEAGADKNPVRGVNAADQILLKSADKRGHPRALLWSYRAGNAPVDLGTLGGPSSWPVHLASDGSSVGWSLNKSGVRRMYFFKPGEPMRDITPADGAAWEPLGLNSSGRILLSYKDGLGRPQFALHSSPGGMPLRLASDVLGAQISDSGFGIARKQRSSELFSLADGATLPLDPPECSASHLTIPGVTNHWIHHQQGTNAHKGVRIHDLTPRGRMLVSRDRCLFAAEPDPSIP